MAMQRTAQVAGEVQGTVVVTQEDRFRIETDDGRSILFVLAPGAGPSLGEVSMWAMRGQRVAVSYRGDPSFGPVAERVRPA